MPNPAKAIFDQALELSSIAERNALLNEVGADDPELRSRVEALLNAYAEAGSFLESIPEVSLHLDRTTEHVPEPLPGVILAGRYKLLQRIGEGGMGTVWMAEQFEPVKRRVAVKLIKAGMDSRQVLARLKAERQALAIIEH